MGHNGSLFNQHLPALKSLANLSQKIANRIRVILPLTYGLNSEYHEHIINACSNLKFETRLLTGFLNDEEVAHLRFITDVFINVQKTDAFCGAMREVLYAGGIVINGSWLPYNFLKEKNIYFRSIDTVEEVERTLISVLENYDEIKSRCENNFEAIFEMSSWRFVIHNWGRVIFN